MSQTEHSRPVPLRVFCLEDNPLIVFHLEQMIEDLGQVFAGALESFADLQDQAPIIGMDCALVDIDLADGMTGPAAVAWLSARGVPSVFVTGQEIAATQHPGASVGLVVKPVTNVALAEAFELLRNAMPGKLDAQPAER
jgi:CheY-like chemotaxis protein